MPTMSPLRTAAADRPTGPPTGRSAGGSAGAPASALPAAGADHAGDTPPAAPRDGTIARSTRVAAGLALAAAWLGMPAANAAAIVAASPQGEVARVQQLVLRFDVPVVALDGGHSPDPAELDCRGPVPAGSGRWVTPRHWVYEFRAALPPGVACDWRLKPGWRPLDGTLSGPGRFAFRTGGPVVERLTPSAGSTITEDQHVLAQFNGAPAAASVAANTWCEIEGIGERVPVRLVVGAERTAVIRAQRREKLDDRLVLLACQRPLPHAARVRLVFGPGIAAAAQPAVATRSATPFDFTVRRAFSAEFSCERERAQAPCLPMRPLVLRFSEPVARSAAQQARLRSAAGGGEALAPVFDKDDPAQEVEELRFPVPLAENTRYRIELPADLRDASGRSLANAASFPLTVATGDAPPIAKFAAAPFGVLERLGEPVLPLTLRHVHGDLRTASPGGQVRVLRVTEPLSMLQAYARVQALHERQLKARDAGLPPASWTEIVSETDARGRTVQRRVDRWIGTREVSMLKALPEARRLELPALQGGDPRPFEVVGIPLPEPGLHVVEIESSRLGAALLAPAAGGAVAPMYVRTAVLVTDLAVHFKLGRESSLAWVTTLDRAQPVADARVDVFDCTGKALWSGSTDAQGRARIHQPLPASRGECLADAGVFVAASRRTADGAQDVAFVFSSWNRGIDPWRFGLPTGSPTSPAELRAHTVFDRTLLRAGETVSMKHFVRRETAEGLAMAEPAQLPVRARITHEGSGQEVTVPLRWNGRRSATSSWAIPAAARLGRYQVSLETEGGARPGEGLGLDGGSFRVEEFRVPLVDARVVPPKGPLVAPREITLDLQLAYLAGGAMAQAPLRGTAQWRERALDFPEWPGFVFQPPRDPAATAVPPADDEDGEPASAGRLVADRVPLATDRHGAARWTIPLPAGSAAFTRAGELRAEVSYLDPNGEVQTASTRVATWPSAIVLGLRTGSWVSARGQVPLTALALDVNGKPLRGQSVEVHARLVQNLATRKRLVGGLYAYDNRTELQDLGVVCGGRTDDRGLFACEATLERAGEIELVARARDGSGQVAQAATSLWITRQGELWFTQDDDDRIDVLPEKTRYEPGETARLQVRMPFREATALVTVEREGVVDSRLVTLRGRDPTVELKIEPGWAPNVYVGVLVLRGRVRHVPWTSFFSWGWKEPLAWARAFWGEGRDYRAPTAMVDLARPSYRFGVAALRVGTAAHTLKVQVSSDRPEYSIRGKAVARIRVTQPDGRPAAGAELAFAAVDEGLLALAPNGSWDLLAGMIRERAWGVETATAQSEVIGRRHYGRKAVPAGGGGGHAGVRELFDTLLVWKPAVTLDANGEAVVEVPLNDSLTRFRLVAVADDGVQAFGTGSTSIRVTQDLQVLAGLPPLVREGDRFAAGLTLRNSSSRALTVRASLAGTVERAGDPAGSPSRLELPPRELSVPANGAQEVNWTVDVPPGASAITWDAAVVETGAAGGRVALQDRSRQRQLVTEAVPLRVVQATLQQLDGSLSLPVAPPAGALAGPTGALRGGIAVNVQPSLGASLPGVRRYFETYPFTCLEQQASKAIGLRDAAQWAAVMRSLPQHLDGDGLAAYFPPRAGDAPAGSDRLTAYLVSAAHEAGQAIPPDALGPMLQGLAAFVQGRIERRPWAPRNDLEVRKLAALAALARHDRADARMLGSIRTAPDAVAQWPTAALIDWLTLLQRLPSLPERAARLAQAQQQLRARLNLAGTVLRFSREDEDFWWWLMDSPDANAARLILALVDDPAWRDELPRLVAGHLGRQREGRWLTTTANAWSAIALERFAARFEAAPVGGRTTATLGTAPAQAVDHAREPAGGRVQLPWPAQQASLTVAHAGSGRPWVTVQALAAIPLATPLRRGYAITRSVDAIEQRKAGAYSRGDVLRVRLEIQADADMTWVVLGDPVPAGATILGSGLGRDALIATTGERQSGSAWIAHDERAFDAFRRYFAHLPRGTHVVEYTLRLNTPGRFVLPPTRIEAMYAPESAGELPNAVLEVLP